MFDWVEVSSTRIECKLNGLRICALERIPNTCNWCVHVFVYRDMTTWKRLISTTLDDAKQEALRIVKHICSDQIALYQTILTAY